jgi:aminoglycoside 3-N-acetyltransferase
MELKENLINKFNQLKIERAQCIFIANDMGKVGLIEQETKKSMLNSIYEAIIEINPKVTIVVPTPTMNIIGSDKVFDLNYTPSIRMGAFSEYIRKLKDSKRSFNALWSLSAVGPLADKITQNISSHAYDKNSSFAKLFEIKDSYFLSIGNHPRFMLSIIHHFETIFNVPYRFTKGFEIYCINANEKFKKTFYLEVLKEEVRYNKRSFNKKIFDNFENTENLLKTDFGKSYMYFFDLKKFYEITSELFKKDINCWWK